MTHTESLGGRQRAAHIDEPLDDLTLSDDDDVGGGNPLEHGWWAAILAIVGLLVGSGSLSDNSFLTHLATGRLIRAGELPHTDPYTFTAGGEPWVVQSWGASWVYASLDALMGPLGIRLLVAALTGALMVLTWRLTRPAGGVVGRLLLVGLCAVLSLNAWNERPQLMAFVAVALVAVIVTERGPSWVLVPIFALWVNVHGSFPVGLAFLVAWAVSEMVERRAITRGDVAPVMWSVGGAVAGALASPYGLELLWFPVRMMGRSESLQYIKEWKRPDIWSPLFLSLVALCLVAAVLLVRDRRFARVGVIAVLLGSALMAARNVPTAALLVIPFAAPAFAGLGTIEVGPRRPLRQTVAVVTVGFAFVAAFMATAPDYDLSPYPTSAVSFLEDRGLVANGETRILAHDYVGNYLEWRYGASANAWIDDRAEVLPSSAIEDYVFLLSDRGDWQEIVTRHDPDLIVWRTDEDPIPAMRGDDGYAEVYVDDGYVVMCRRAGSVNCATI